MLITLRGYRVKSAVDIPSRPGSEAEGGGGKFKSHK